MKNSIIAFVSAFLLIFCSTSILAQGVSASADKSPVLVTHHYDELPLFVECPQFGSLGGDILTHVIEQELPNGDLTFHMNFNGEVTDAQGEIWTFKDAWVTRENPEDGFWIYNDHGFVLGPNGERFKLQFTLIVNRIPFWVVFIFDPMCD